MNATKKHQYGLAAMVQLGFSFEKGPIQLRHISEQAVIPHAFLEQLMLDLKKSRLVKSTRGAKGGYQLANSPDKISVQAIFSAIDPLVFESSQQDSLAFFWSNLNSHINHFFDLSLQSLLEDVLKKEEVLTYAI